ncbi:hypothetical protein NU136_000002 [Salmonella enterica]|nr:hypothetical protein [Salmonella enterica]
MLYTDVSGYLFGEIKGKEGELLADINDRIVEFSLVEEITFNRGHDVVISQGFQAKDQRTITVGFYILNPQPGLVILELTRTDTFAECFFVILIRPKPSLTTHDKYYRENYKSCMK